jgi:hypothetical protein
MSLRRCAVVAEMGEVEVAVVVEAVGAAEVAAAAGEVVVEEEEVDSKLLKQSNLKT